MGMNQDLRRQLWLKWTWKLLLWSIDDKFLHFSFLHRRKPTVGLASLKKKQEKRDRPWVSDDEFFDDLLYITSDWFGCSTWKVRSLLVVLISNLQQVYFILFAVSKKLYINCETNSWFKNIRSSKRGTL